MDGESVDLKVDVNDKASAALKALAESIGRVTQAEAAMGRQADQLRRQQEALEKQKKDFAAQKEKDKKPPALGDRAAQAAGLAGGLARGGAGLGGMAGIATAAGPWGAAAAGFASVLEAGAKRVTAALNTLNDGTQSRAQKENALASAFVPFYDTFKALDEAMNGTAEAMRKSAKTIEVATAAIAYAAAAREQTRAAEHEADVQFNRKAAWDAGGLGGGDRARLVRESTFDRSTNAGDIATRAYETVAGAEDAARRARVERDAAAQAYKAQGGIAGNAEDRAEAARVKSALARDAQEKLFAEENRTRKRNKRGRAAQDAEAIPAVEESLDKAKAAQAELARLKELGLRAAQAELAAAQAALDVDRARLTLMEQQEQRMAGLAGKLGEMTEFDFEYSREALRTVVENGGITDLPPEIVEAAGQVAGGYIGKQKEARGSGYARQLAGEFGDSLGDAAVSDFGQKGDLSKVREEVAKAKVDLRIKMDLNEKEVADRIAKELEANLGKLVKQVRAVESEQKSRDRARDLQQWNQQN